MKTTKAKKITPEVAFNLLKSSKSRKSITEKEIIKYEKCIAKDSYYAFEYAMTLKKRFVVGEKTIYRSGNYFDYHKKFFEGRNPEYEKEVIELLKSHSRTLRRYCDFSFFEDVVEYVSNVIKGRWEELEKAIIQNLVTKLKDEVDYFMMEYVRATKSPWEDAENYFIKKLVKDDSGMSSPIIEEYIEITQSPIPKLEKIFEKIKIYKNPSYEQAADFYRYFECATKYAEFVKKDRWEVVDNWLKNGVCENYDVNITDYYLLIEKKIKESLNNKDSKFLEYQDCENFVDVVTSFSRKNQVSEEVKNYMVARSLVNSKETETFFELDKKFKIRVREYLSQFDKDCTIGQFLSNL